ncbi:MAG: hypothetical protein IJ447_05770 [Clostridia bacterium]|nr:hypothetical protein [Clostridia bacterium]
MPDMFEGYLSVVRSTIHNKRLHDPICLELEGHMQDKADFYVEIGYDELTAQRKALEEMGDPRLVAENMGKIHNLSGKQYLVLVAYHIAVFVNLIMELGLFNLIDFFGEGSNYSFVYLKHFSAFVLLILWSVWLSLSYRRKTPAITSVITILSGIPSVWWFSFAFTHLITGKLEYFAGKMLCSDKFWFDVNFTCISAVVIFGLILALSVATVIMSIRYNNSAFMSDKKIKKNTLIAFLSMLLVFAVVFSVNYIEVEKQETIHAETFADLRIRFIDFIQNDGNGAEGDVENILTLFNDVEFTQQTTVNDYGQKITELKGKKGVAVLEFFVNEDKSLDAYLRFDDETFSATNVLGFFSIKSTFNHKNYLLMDSAVFNTLVDNFELISRTDTIVNSIEIFRGVNYLHIQYSFDADENSSSFHTRIYGPESLFFGTNDFYLTEENGRIVHKDSILD